MRRVRGPSSAGRRAPPSPSSAESWSRPTSGETRLDSRSERVLLTGSGGFTGRPLAARLRRDGHRVFGLTKGPALDGEIQGDLHNRDWVRRTVAEIQPTVT